jgi:putative membrane protein
MNAVHGWTRLSLWSVLHFVAALGAHAFQQFWAAIPIAFATLSAGVAWLLPLLAGGFVILVLVALLQYRAFTYRLHGEGIEVRSGVVHKRQVNLQAQRVQNVRITQPVYFRPLGLVSLHIDSAGSSTDEVCLAALDAEQAQELQRWMMAESKHTVHADAVEVGEEITRADCTGTFLGVDERFGMLIRSGAQTRLIPLTALLEDPS